MGHASLNAFKCGLISGVLPVTLWEAMGTLGAPAAVLPISLQEESQCSGPRNSGLVGASGWLKPICLPMKRSPGQPLGADPHSDPDLLGDL